MVSLVIIKIGRKALLMPSPHVRRHNGPELHFSPKGDEVFLYKELREVFLKSEKDQSSQLEGAVRNFKSWK